MHTVIATAIQSKIVSLHAIKAHRGVEVQLHLLLTWALGGYEQSASHFGRITPGTHRRGQLPNIFSLEEFLKYLFICLETPI
jgi:hypothetical protein